MSQVQEDARIADILPAAVARLKNAGIQEAKIDAELLLGHCLDKTRTELYLSADKLIDDAQHLSFNDMISRRCRREPVAYITGEREFWSQRFIVTPDVLIPRPETEFLIESALQAWKQKSGVDHCLDICCGSGVIGIIMAMETGCRAFMTDISFEALLVCKKNCTLHGVADQIVTVQSDLASCVNPEMRFDLITANPPYVTRGEIETDLDSDVAFYEPHLALDGGEDGLDLIRRIARSVPCLLNPGGDFFMEIGHDQGDRVQKIFVDNQDKGLYKTVAVYKDYAGRDRVVHVRRK